MNRNTNQTNQKTLNIAGHDITLESEKWYIAHRPIATKKANETFQITISTEGYEPVLKLAKMSYDDANAFLAAFNNGDCSLDGRVW